MPSILNRFPDSVLTVCGSSPNARLRRRLTRARFVNLIADPDDLVPIYQMADVTLIPLAEGGGTRIKVLESLAIGLPVIATQKAVQGLNLRHREHFLQAHTPAEFADAIASLKVDSELRTKIIGQGRELVEQNHSQGVIDEAVRASLSRVLANGRSN